MDKQDRTWWTPEEIAQEFRVTRKVIYDEIGAGKLRALQVGPSIRVPERAIAEYVATAWISPAEFCKKLQRHRATKARTR